MPRNSNKLTSERLRQVLTIDPSLGTFVWKIMVCRKRPAGSEAGGKTPKGYKQIQIDGENFLAHHLMWFYVHGEWPKDQIDHENRNKSDNRIDNLRHTDGCRNHQNIGLISTNTSGYKGVSWSKSASKWQAVIIAFRKNYFLGYFDRKEDAARAYVKAAQKHHGEFACIN